MPTMQKKGPFFYRSVSTLLFLIVALKLIAGIKLNHNVCKNARTFKTYSFSNVFGTFSPTSPFAMTVRLRNTFIYFFFIVSCILLQPMLMRKCWSSC